MAGARGARTVDPCYDAPVDAVLDLDALDGLFAALRDRGYTVVGPTVRAGSIAFDEVASTADLPGGWVDVQEGGSFRLQRGPDDALFAHTVGHDSLKRWLFPPVRAGVARPARRRCAPVVPEPPPRYAFVGVRSCDLHAVAIQDRVFLGDRHVEEDYARAGAGAFFVAAQCARAGGTCFCASMDTGPRAQRGLRPRAHGDPRRRRPPLRGRGGHRARRGGPGRRGLAAAATRPSGARRTRPRPPRGASMGRALDTTGLRDLLFANLEHPRWDDVADRCLSCGNCTMVCPTCFCSAVEDTTDLAGERGRRARGVWDSCFTLEHSYLHGGSVRRARAARYRQWMTHKLASWIDQFGTSGCVGCGRCITWCPVAIDITEEVAAIRGAAGRGRADDR